jgi:hypothetical protein
LNHLVQNFIVPLQKPAEKQIRNNRKKKILALQIKERDEINENQKLILTLEKHDKTLAQVNSK